MGKTTTTKAANLELAKTTTETPMPLAATIMPADQAERLAGEEFTEQYRRLIGALIDQIVFGDMGLKIAWRLRPSERAGNSGSGRYEAGSGFKGWLKNYAPTVPEGTAYRYMKLAEAVRHALQFGPRTDLRLLLTAPMELIEKMGLAKKRQELLDFIEGKTQRQLLLTFEHEGPGPGGNHHAKCPHCGGDLASRTQEICPRCQKPTGQHGEVSAAKERALERLLDGAWEKIDSAKLLICARLEDIPVYEGRKMAEQITETARMMTEYFSLSAHERQNFDTSKLWPKCFWEERNRVGLKPRR